MLSLLKADLFRIIKSKLFIIGLILTVAMPVLVVGMEYVAIKVIGTITEGDIVGTDIITAKQIIASSFSLTKIA